MDPVKAVYRMFTLALLSIVGCALFVYSTDTAAQSWDDFDFPEYENCSGLIFNSGMGCRQPDYIASRAADCGAQGGFYTVVEGTTNDTCARSGGRNMGDSCRAYCEIVEPDPDPVDCPAAGTTVTIEFPGNQNPVSKDGCGIMQSGDSACDDGVGDQQICTAEFTYTGEPYNPGDGDGDGGDGGDGDDGDGGDGDGDGGDGGDGDGGDGGDGDGDGDGDGGGPGGPGGPGGDGDCQGDDCGDGSAGGGGNCQAPPTCDGDEIQCAILQQQWLQRCPSGEIGELTGLTYELDIDDRTQQAIDEYQQKFDEIKDQFSDLLGVSFGGSGGGLESNVRDVYGAQVELGIFARADFFDWLRNIVFFAFALASFMIIMRAK